ncbi:hypothetical protein GQ44DRAFT_628094 [Phaeosphaeriaceae sp. PMI808]|nr:hypothetical protein GQ44DRAFT_628094 [Phaeosphaeriaceae sp. PMI808]
MSCALGNMFIAVVGGLVDRSSRRKSLSVTKPMALKSSRVFKELSSSLRGSDRQ